MDVLAPDGLGSRADLTTTAGARTVAVSILLLGVALLGAMLPARRAMRADPLDALRAE